MSPPALVVLNPASRGGKGRALWKKVAPAVARRLAHEVIETDLDGAWQREVSAAIERGIRVFVAAGGDGTVSALVRVLCAARGEQPLGAFTLGAVGLGSSNDFHKPFDLVEAGVPLRVDARRTVERDVGLAHYAAADGTVREHPFLVSASLGVTAQGNAFFNRGDRLLAWLKPRTTPGAILYAALRTLSGYRNFEARLTLDGTQEEVAITNLSVMKTPYLSGSFRFDTPVEPADGLFAVNLCEGMSRVDALRTLVDLGRGRFLGKRGRRHWRAHEVLVVPSRPVALELDGEVVEACRVRLTVLPERIHVCL